MYSDRDVVLPKCTVKLPILDMQYAKATRPWELASRPATDSIDHAKLFAAIWQTTSREKQLESPKELGGVGRAGLERLRNHAPIVYDNLGTFEATGIRRVQSAALACAETGCTASKLLSGGGGRGEVP